jgi:hypothetical protein
MTKKGRGNPTVELVAKQVLYTGVTQTKQVKQPTMGQFHYAESWQCFCFYPIERSLNCLADRSGSFLATPRYQTVI